jgi:hypothetical protein
MQQPSLGQPLKLWAMEQTVLRCRCHDAFAYLPNALIKCGVCNMMPVNNPKIDYFAVQCQLCCFGDGPFMVRCCELMEN